MAGIAYQTAQRFPGFVCRIAGQPASDPCVNTSPASAYWAYWIAAPGGSWCYSTFGAASRRPPPGTFEGWSFALDRTAAELPPPRFDPPAVPAGAAPITLNASDCASTPQPPASSPPTAAQTVPTTPAPSPPTPAATTSPTATAVSSTAPDSTIAPSTVPEPTAVETSVATTTTTPAGEAVAAGTVDLGEDGGGGGSAIGFVASAAVVVGLGTAAALIAASPPVARRSVTLRGDRLPRELHPGAWWIWALGMATAATRTTNPLLLGAIIAVVALVVAARRGDSPWSRGFRGYVIVALVVIAVRVALRTVLDGQYGEHVLFRLPELPLPDAAQGIEIGGPVSLEGLLAAFYDGLRLATLILCFGAANVLANPKRLLKSMPSGLHEIGVSITVALSMAPQLVESARRVHRARRLRGGDTSRKHVIRQVAIPVMTDALDRSLLLAAAMDARGHGRTAHTDDADACGQRRARAVRPVRRLRRRLRSPRRHHTCCVRRTDADPRHERGDARTRPRRPSGAHVPIPP